MCELCNTPDINGDYDPCCNQGLCTAIPSLSVCECCGAEMFEENGFWFHHSQREIDFDDREIHNEI